jgi:hypothetical protein
MAKASKPTTTKRTLRVRRRRSEKMTVQPLAVPATTSIPVAHELYIRLSDFGSSRGLDVETLARVALSSLLRAGHFYALDTPLSFGQYAGEKMETVIRLNPGYVRWAIEHVDGMCLSEGAQALLDNMLTRDLEAADPDVPL